MYWQGGFVVLMTVILGLPSAPRRKHDPPWGTQGVRGYLQITSGDRP